MKFPCSSFFLNLRRIQIYQQFGWRYLRSSSWLAKNKYDKDNDLASLNDEPMYKTKYSEIRNSDVPINYEVRATNKFFFGPLQETVVKRRLRLKSEDSTTPIDRICEEAKFKFHDDGYENFASMHANNKPPIEKNDEPNIDYLICNQLNKSNFLKRQAGKKKSSKNHSARKIFKGNSLEVTKLNSRKAPKSAILQIKPSLKYVDIPSEINLKYLNDFSLYMNDDDRLPIDTNEKNEIISISYKGEGIKKLPSVTTILTDTMSDKSRQALAKWAENMIEIMGVEEFQRYKQELFADGHQLHSCIQNSFYHKLEPTKDDVSKITGYWGSISQVLEHIKDEGDIRAVETRVVHPHLHYAGIVDCIAYYKGIPVLIEWKTSSRVKNRIGSTFDNPLQLAAYLGAMQHDPNYRHFHEVQSCLLVIAYSFGDDCNVMLLSQKKMMNYWEVWKKRLSLYWKLNRNI